MPPLSVPDLSGTENLSTIRALRPRVQGTELPAGLHPPTNSQGRRATSEPPRLSKQQVPSILDMEPGSPWIRSDAHMRDDQEADGDALAQSYDSANDPEKLNFWWEAGIRDGDPVATPPLMTESSPSLSSLAGALPSGFEGSAGPDELETSRIAPGSINAIDVLRARAEVIRQSKTNWAPSSISEGPVELGREIAPSLSGKTPFNRTSAIMGDSVQVVDEDDHYGLMTVTNSGKRLLEPAELLQTTQSHLTFRVSRRRNFARKAQSADHAISLYFAYIQEWDTDMLLNSSTKSRERLEPRMRISNESPASSRTSLDGPAGGILAPEKATDSEATSRVSPPGVDPSDLRISVSKTEAEHLVLCSDTSPLLAARLATLGSNRE